MQTCHDDSAAILDTQKLEIKRAERARRTVEQQLQEATSSLTTAQPGFDSDSSEDQSRMSDEAYSVGFGAMPTCDKTPPLARASSGRSIGCRRGRAPSLLLPLPKLCLVTGIGCGHLDQQFLPICVGWPLQFRDGAGCVLGPFRAPLAALITLREVVGVFGHLT